MANKETKYRQLTAAEAYVIIDKGTEPPGSGRYDQHFQNGIYHCRRCDTPLYNSSAKFNAGCGWPSFDDEIPGAVRRMPDADGRRSEILCKTCGAHLGHVFSGENLTAKNTHHCVNSIALSFTAEKDEQKTGVAYFGGGCFWGLDYYFQRATGVLSTRAGYMGGKTSKPNYEQVCSGNSGHIEIIKVEFDKNQTDYEQLARLFFEIHDPGQVDRQGPDVGEQYKSVIFYLDTEQKKTADYLINILRQKGCTVVTELRQAETFWLAEGYHQNYYEKSASTPYCHFYTRRF